MHEKKGLGVSFEALRKEAERIVRAKETTSMDDDELDLVRLAHELEVHQVELELQNDELQRANKELEASRKEFVDLYQFAPVAFVTVNEKGVIEQANAAAARMLAASEDFPAGGLFPLLVYPADQGVYFSCLERIALNSAAGSCELRLQGKDRRLVHVHLEASPKHDGQGRTHWRLALVDITQRKKFEEELEIKVRERTAELARSNRELEDFAFVASHDLQEPLRKIQMFADLLKGANLKEERSRDYFERMTKAAQRMQEMIEALLEYSRITTKARPFAPVSLNDAVKEALGYLQSRLQETGGRVSLEDLPTVEAEPSHMVRLFQNLLGNALKFHRDGEPPIIRIYAEPMGATRCRVHVEDNGIGFDEKYLDRVFKPFERLVGRQYEGSGMGLAISRKIVERHGGNISARSTKGKGTSFIIELPLRQARGNGLESSNPGVLESLSSADRVKVGHGDSD